MPREEHQSSQGHPSAEDTGTAEGHDELASQLSELARSLQASADTDQVLDEVVAAAVALIPGVEQASISVVTARQHVSSPASTGDLPREVDALQVKHHQGPCLDAVYEQQTVRVADMAHEERWPDFARHANDIGARSMLAFQLYVEGDNLGALNLYSSQPQAFDDESEHVGLLFASHAAIAYADSQKLNHLQQKAASRDLIGQAKGILMERHKLTADEAFRVLVRVSIHRNEKLRDVAEQLVTTGQIPTAQPTQKRPLTAGPSAPPAAD
jgi:transcriptional regulator with GAF, ATPase, and Fis domain